MLPQLCDRALLLRPRPRPDTGEYTQHQPGQDQAGDDDLEELRGVWRIGPAVALVAPDDRLAMRQLPLHGLELPEVLCGSQLIDMTLEALEELAVAGERVEARVGGAVVAGVEAQHRCRRLRLLRAKG